MTLPRRITEPALPMSALEILCHLREGSASEATLVNSYLYEAMSRIEEVCARSISLAKYELILPGFPRGIDRSAGPLPFSSSNASFYGNGSVRDCRFSSAVSPAIMLEMPPVRKIESVKYYSIAGQINTNFDSEIVGSLSTMKPDKYALQQDYPGLLYPTDIYPATAIRRDAVKIVFWAGEVDEIQLNSSSPRFTSLSGYGYSNGDSFVLSASGNRSTFLIGLGDVATIPKGVVEGRSYYVVNASGSSFDISATSGGSAISLTAPESPLRLDKLYAGRMSGVVSAAVRKIAMDSYSTRCGEGECSCSSDSAFEDPVLRRLKWQSIVGVM